MLHPIILTLFNNNFTKKKEKHDICIFSSCTSISKFGLQKQQTPNKFISSIYLKIWDVPLWHGILQTANYFLYCGRLPSARNTTYVHASGTYTMWDLLKSNTVTWYVNFWGFVYIWKKFDMYSSVYSPFCSSCHVIDRNCIPATLHSPCQQLRIHLLPPSLMRMLQILEDQWLSEGGHTQEGLYKIHKTTESIWHETATNGSNVKE